MKIHAYLASTLTVFVFTLQLMGLLLFVYNAERMLEFFVTSNMSLSVAIMPSFRDTLDLKAVKPEDFDTGKLPKAERRGYSNVFVFYTKGESYRLEPQA